MLVLTDVTRMRRLESVRRDFVTNVSHELRTPVTSIRGYAETLLDGAAVDAAESRRFLSIIAKHAERLESLIEDLLYLSRIEQEAERKELPREDTRIADVLQAAVESRQSLAAERGVGVELVCDGGVRAAVNAALLEHAVANLIDNAVKYSERGGVVEVECDDTGDEVSLRVRDHGCGIADEHHGRIFERFYRVDRGRSREQGGTGLGLAIVKHIAQAHRGSVDVESAPGRGSTFTIRDSQGVAVTARASGSAGHRRTKEEEVMARIAFSAVLVLCLLVALTGPGAAAGVQDLEIGGRFIQDWIAWGDVDDTLGVSSDDATEVRSAYVSAKGKLAAHLRFKADYDFAGGDVGVKDVYLEIFGIPRVGNARVGHWTVPVGLDQITSTKNLSFLEGGSCMALTPGRNSGLMLWNTLAGGRVTAELGAFKDVDDFAEASGSGEGGSVAARIYGAHRERRRGEEAPPRGGLGHRVGPVRRRRCASGRVPSFTWPAISWTPARCRSRPRRPSASSSAGVFGPAHFQGEYVMSSATALDEAEGGERDLAEDASFSGYYVQGGYFLTGESRGYKGTSFDRTKVKSDFLDEGGWGAWEVLARYSSLDLNDEDAGRARRQDGRRDRRPELVHVLLREAHGQLRDGHRERRGRR